MDYRQNFDSCWYKDACTQAINSCDKAVCNYCIRFLEMSHLMEESDIPKNKQYPIALYPEDIDYDVFIRLSEYKQNIEDYVLQGKNLYICSVNPGNGKTTWAIKMMLKYFDMIWAGNGFRARGLFVHVPTLLMQLKNFNNPLSEEYKNKLLNCDLVIFDDVAVSGISQFDYNNLLMYLDSRILNEKSNIFTSNKVTKDELDKSVGSRLSSRIWETSTRIEFKGKDRRNG